MSRTSTGLAHAVTAIRGELQLGRQHIDRLDRRRLRQELGRLRHQRRGNLTSEMRLSSGLVGEGVENPERRWSDLEGEPDGRGCLGVGERQGTLEERFNSRV